MKMQQRKWTDFLGSPIRRFAVCSAEREYTRSLKCPLQTLVTPFKTFDPQIDHVHDNLLVAVAAVISTKLFFSDFPCGNRLCIFQQVHLPADGSAAAHGILASANDEIVLCQLVCKGTKINLPQEAGQGISVCAADPLIIGFKEIHAFSLFNRYRRLISQPKP